MQIEEGKRYILSIDYVLREERLSTLVGEVFSVAGCPSDEEEEGGCGAGVGFPVASVEGVR